MTTQDAYNRMVESFSQPGRMLAKTVQDEPLAGCFYRPEPDFKFAKQTREGCAIGCLLSDKAARKLMYFNPGAHSLLTNLWTEYENAVQELEGVDLRFLIAAQHAHDSAISVQMFLERLTDLGQQYNLSRVSGSS